MTKSKSSKKTLPKVDSKAIIAAVKAEKSDRRKISLYLSEKAYADFKDACGDVPVSAVMEKLMRAFVESNP